MPGMKTTRLARRLGLDRNPLRRRTDKIAVYVAVLLLAVFLIGAPLLSVAAVGWAARAGATGQRAERSWRLVSAVLLQAATVRGSVTGGVFGYHWVPARWNAPDGRARTGQIPVSTDLAIGHTVRLWVDAAGTPTGPPVNHGAVVADEAAAAAAATGALGLVLLCLAWAGRQRLDRCRLHRLGSGMGRRRPPVDQALPVAGLAVATGAVLADRSLHLRLSGDRRRK